MDLNVAKQILDGSVLIQYCIYRQPLDFPNHYVVRRWYIGVEEKKSYILPDAYACLCQTLNEARLSVPRGLVCLSRELFDEWQIVETWM